ncbi:MAG: DUF975 family protein [Clostridiales Family XIII bacterium]|jgi:uncharacterized membrane protein|nr:DUF975 family protein [Clostridiales Family XIII bacterium]
MEQNIIVTEPARSIRRIARMELQGRWKTAILVYILYFILRFVPTVLIEFLFGGGTDFFAYEFTVREMRAQTMSLLYTIVIEGPLYLGLTVFLLSLVRGAKHSPGMVLDGFNSFFRAMGLFWLVVIFIGLWSLLFFIPGIIAAFAYAQAFFLLADDPHIGLRYAIKQSRRLMIGNKWKFFCLQLSFIGWICLAWIVYAAITVPFGLLPFALPGIPSIEDGGLLALSSDQAIFLLQIVASLGRVVFAPVYMYVFTAQAIFYEVLTGRRRFFSAHAGFVADAAAGGGEAWRPEADTERADGAPGGRDSGSE